MDTPSSVEAQEALDQVRQVRRDTADALRTPWWLWAALGVILALELAANDYGSTAQEVSALGLGILTVAWVVARRRSPRVAAVSGVPHRSALPWYAWLPILLIGIVAGTVQVFTQSAAHRLLTGSGMPAWIRDHPYTTAAAPYALISIAVGLLISVVVRRMARHAPAR